MQFISLLTTAALAALAAASPVKLLTKPALGETGVWYDAINKVTEVHFGNNMETHAAHIMYHDLKYPAHANAIFKLADGTRKDKLTEYGQNAYEALHDVDRIPGFVRDEKPWASLSHGAKMTSVVKVPKDESQIESALARVAKDVHLSNAASQGVKLIDNRTTKTALDPSLILKAMKRSLSSIVGDAKNKTEGALEGAEGDAKNATDSSSILSGLENDWDALEAKLVDLIQPVMDDLDGAGDDITTAVQQVIMPEGSQLGVFWQGFNCFDSQWNYTAFNNASSMTNTSLAQDQAALEVYNSGYNNASNAIPSELSDLMVKMSNMTV